MDAREVAARERRVADVLAGAVDEVDDPVREAGLLEDAHRVVGGEHRRRGGLPEHGVAHERGRAREVAADRGEVERRDGEDEAFERPVLQAVPDARARTGCSSYIRVMNAGLKRQKSIELAGRVDLGLVGGLGLAEHRGRVQRVAPRARRAARPRGGRRRPAPPTGRGASPPRPRPTALTAASTSFGAALVDVREDVVLVVRHHRFLGGAGAHLLAADDQRDVQALVPHLLQAQLEARALGRAGRVVPDRLVDGRRNAEDARSAHDRAFYWRGHGRGGV